MKKAGKILFIVLLIAFISIQFVRSAPNNGSADDPHDITHYVQVPVQVQHILKTSCYDCHSNHTDYPWYSRINPVGMWLDHHIEEGKAELNFSDFSTYSTKKIDHKLEETAEEAAEGHMPLPAYTFLHTDAQLGKAQVEIIVAWVKTQRAQLQAASAK